MVNPLQGWITRVLRIPPEPDPPFGAPGTTRVFRASRGYLRYRLLLWLGRQLGALFGILLIVIFPAWDPLGVFGPIIETFDRVFDVVDKSFPISLADVVWGFELLALGGFLIQLPFSLTLVLLDYEYRWYMVTDRSLRIREGLMRVDERTMTFSNIQHISVSQGPLQRWFGFADLEVRSAGGGGGASDDIDAKSGSKTHHVVSFRGISNPREVGDIIQEHLESLKGPGGPQEPPPEVILPPEAPTQRGAVPAARSVLREVRALRAAWNRGCR